MTYIDEFGHIGPYVSRTDPRHNDSPVFGLAGFALPIGKVRAFGTWFFQRKQELLAFEIAQQAAHPAVWEKKGSALYTAKNVSKYRALRQFTFRFLNQIRKQGGFVIYVGVRKDNDVAQHNANRLYLSVLKEMMERLNQLCLEDHHPSEDFLLVMDEHDSRADLVTEAARAMYNAADPGTALIEPPFQAESYRYQTLQAADWLAGLIGRLTAYEAEPSDYPENQVHKRYFALRLQMVARRSGMRAKTP